MSCSQHKYARGSGRHTNSQSPTSVLRVHLIIFCLREKKAHLKSYQIIIITNKRMKKNDRE